MPLLKESEFQYFDKLAYEKEKLIKKLDFQNDETFKHDFRELLTLQYGNVYRLMKEEKRGTSKRFKIFADFCKSMNEYHRNIQKN